MSNDNFGKVGNMKANQIPLILSKTMNSKASHALPLPLGRKLGDLSDSDVIITPPSKRRMHGVMADFYAPLSINHVLKNCQSHHTTSKAITNDWQIDPKTSRLINQHHHAYTVGFIHLANHANTKISPSYLKQNCTDIYVQGLKFLGNVQYNPLSLVTHYRNCANVRSAQVAHFKSCISPKNTGVTLFTTDYQNIQQGQLRSNCHRTKIQKAVPVPCRYYPIAPPPPEAIIRHCQVRPPSSRLPIKLRRKSKQFPSFALPFNLQCWHDDEPLIVPNLRSYIVHNTVSATVAGININPLSFSIRTDINSYCWQGSVELTTKDYAKIKAKLDVAHGNEPLITVNINGYLFSIIAEEQSRTRQFVNHSYNLSGRSITARLGADYAQSQSGLLDQDNYASQIVNQQLNGLAITVDEWTIADWLIPANQYSVSNKTPIAVINDIAQACGGFLTSHANEPKLSLKAKYKVPAWEIATATPDVVINLDVIRQINEQKRINPRYNTITLTGQQHGGIVYRQTENREQDAPSIDNPLFTDRDCIVPMGIKTLSDSGIHMEYTITLRWADKYNLNLAKLGDIWQVNDSDGAWKGIVTGVAIDVKLENDVPTVWQTVAIDRYLDV